MCVHEGRACYVKGRLQPVRSFGDLHLKLEGEPCPARPDQTDGFCCCCCCWVAILF